MDWDKIQSVNNLEVFIFTFLANIFVLGSFALIGFAWPTYRLLPEYYYQISNPKKLLSITKKLGVIIFQIFLLQTFWKNKKQQKDYFNGTKSGIIHFINESKRSEFGHLLPFLILLILSFWSLYLGFWKMALVNFFLNILANFYPILLQRRHRARIYRVSMLLKDSTNNSA